MSLRGKTMPASQPSCDATQPVDVSPAGRPSTRMTSPSPPRKKERERTKKHKAVKRALNMDTESDRSDKSDSSEDDIQVLALMHQLDPSAPPFKLARCDSDIFQLPPLDMPRFFLQEINKTDEDATQPLPPHEVMHQLDPSPPELLRSSGKQPMHDPEGPSRPELLRSISKPAKSAPSITASLKKFAKPPRHMDGGSSAYNATRLARTKSVCFQRTRSPEATPTWGGGALALPDVLVTPTKPTTPVALAWGGGNGGPPRPFVVPDVLVTPTKPPPTPPTPPTPGSPDVPPPDVNACSPINIAAAILPVPAKPPPNPDSLHGTIRNLFALADPYLGIAEFANFDD